MKRTILLLIAVIISNMMMAEGITAEQAAEIARQFVNRQTATGASTESRQAAQARQMRMATKRQMPMSVATEANSNAYYIFNIGSNDGYVMVSGSDLTPQVLGYASEGSFSEDDMPANMKAWLDGYAEQIAYIERTQGSNQAPVMRIARDAIDPLLTTTWYQKAPYNNMCPEVNGQHALTGCGATALAQVMNYFKYPAQTTMAIPAYTTMTHSIDMPEMPVTDIDWGNILDNYSGSETAEQKNAVATLMRLCGQAMMMDYTEYGSGADMSYAVKALRQYFGYDETVHHIERNTFSTSEWENIIYDEVANGRPVFYGGQASIGGHGFVVDGYDGNGLFHVNWGWNGTYNGYFLLSVLNPYNNEALDTTSSDDGFSFAQEAIVGIQHGTGEKVAERFRIYGMTNNGASSYTRSSATENFSGMIVTVSLFNMTGETHDFWTKLALTDGSGSFIAWASDIVDFSDALEYSTGGPATFENLSFGANMADGDYYITAMSHSENAEEWEPCWGSEIYRIKATISGNTLTLTQPEVNLSAIIYPVDSAMVNTTVSLQALITNNGTDFNDYVFLDVDDKLVGGRMFEAKAGETVTFNIEFMPTTPGTKILTLFYVKDMFFETEECIPFATGRIAIGEDTSGIVSLPTSDQPFDVFNTMGVKVKSQTTSMKGLSQGIYIVKGKTLYIKD